MDKIVDKSGNSIPKNERIDIGNWLRPVLKNNNIVIITEKIDDENNYEWRVCTKDYIKSISD
ncbi:MAG: hypothetical protein HN704_01850 [Bacteroidetes bacterium]|nr:hypothetical protein [Bacteroidota bacterium]MBT6687161.1 hypothetical protein [Bacteroidota bacterium]MBT7142382.1 hypothetical protein [Bacteroidota bacterium]MBT7490330.1 hypothetical protein [Bacteroidota bacterium]